MIDEIELQAKLDEHVEEPKTEEEDMGTVISGTRPFMSMNLLP